MTRRESLFATSLLIAASLAVAKGVMAAVSGSLALAASAVDSGTDFLMSLANWAFLRSAMRPADADHPYGHGKIESLAAFGQGFVLAAAAVSLVWAALKRFIHPAQPTEVGLGLAVTVVAAAINFWHGRNLAHAARDEGSPLMAAESAHFVADLYGYLAVIAALVLGRLTGWAAWDPLFSILIAGYLIVTAWNVLRGAVGELMDEQLPKADLDEIDRLVRSAHPAVIDYHDLRTRSVGGRRFIEFHIELRGIESFREAHEISERVVSRLREAFRDAVVTVHADPEGAE